MVLSMVVVIQSLNCYSKTHLQTKVTHILYMTSFYHTYIVYDVILPRIYRIWRHFITHILGDVISEQQQIIY